MSVREHEVNLKTIIDEIKSNKIMLPDFQRQFAWDIERQKALIASVLTQLPVGSFITRSFFTGL